MNLEQARDLALTLLKAYDLKDWSFSFDYAKRRFGSCNYTHKKITLSKYLCDLNDLAQVRETLLHEIAHALTPGDHHGKKWQAKCRELGIKPERCYQSARVNQPEAPFLLVCLNCNLKLPRVRRSSKIYVCRRCCQRYNGGKVSEKYRLEWRLA